MNEGKHGMLMLKSPRFDLLIFAAVSCSTAMMAFVAVVGPIVRHLHLSEWHAGLSVTAAGVFWLLLARHWGSLSDRRGRRPVLFLGLFGYGLVYVALAAFVAFGIANPITPVLAAVLLIGTRALIGAFYSAIPVAASALIADQVAPERRARAMAKLAAASSFGLVIGPSAAGILAAYGLQWPLFAAALLPWIVLLVLTLWLPVEPVVAASRPQTRVQLFDSRLRLPMFAAFAAMVCVSIAQVVVGFFALDRLGLDSERGARAAGYALTAVGIALIVAQTLLMRTPGVAPRRWIAMGAAVAAIGFAGAALSNDQSALIAAYAVAAFGMGFVFPAFQAAAANCVQAHEQGVAAGSVAAAQGLGMIAGPLTGTLLYRISPSVPYLLVVVILITLFSVTLRAPRT